MRALALCQPLSRTDCTTAEEDEKKIPPCAHLLLVLTSTLGEETSPSKKVNNRLIKNIFFTIQTTHILKTWNRNKKRGFITQGGGHSATTAVE